MDDKKVRCGTCGELDTPYLMTDGSHFHLRVCIRNLAKRVAELASESDMLGLRAFQGISSLDARLRELERGEALALDESN